MDQKEQLKLWIQQYYDRLTYIAYTYLKDHSHAEDIVQDSFVNAYRSNQQLKDPTRPFPWLVRIVINECHNSIRQNRREQPTEFLPEQRSISTEDLYLEQSRDQEVYSAIMSLNEKFRTPVILFYFEDMSIREIAHALKLSEGAVKTRLARGRDKLKGKLRRGDLDELGDDYSASKANLYPR
ncbi:sigma-70 family RNA polymerase sigma factor [Paenibacillus sp. GP183]|jgi:RNA polymerase sigma-70 factor, ECF subfamily|uniref:RNA polymerase sigma factor n=1 Tax=Paenibacillus sp. GP183 TaxID=1882751 RepID=UPI00089D0C05|nr:sigma-70 family RNA polymerase sigma factor [Paenibacillus sp. GP183]SEC59317.1 RNA polymerase sigma-70 factor, ECF subfamily [Paenibacillus sp. GP183]